jgi:hypothetical protein
VDLTEKDCCLASLETALCCASILARDVAIDTYVGKPQSIEESFCTVE